MPELFYLRLMGKVGWHRAWGRRANASRGVSAASIVMCTLGVPLFCVAGEHDSRAQGSNAKGPAQSAPVKSGDCKAALDTYDRAAEVRIDPVLRRDRGLCHEELGHPYPAIDDYRYYLTNRPNAPDAESIRTRLTRLEEQVGINGPSTKDSGDDAAGTSGGKATVRLGARASGDAAEGKARDLDAIENDEKLDAEAEASSLRRGTGFVIGLSIGVARYTKEAFGWTEQAGLDLRYSLSSVSTLLVDFGYAHVNSSGTASALGGAAVILGYEARIALNPRLNDALLVGGTLSYEHLAQSASGLVFATFIPQGRFGYRHVLGPALGLEAAFDGGFAIFHLTGAPIGTDASTTSLILGGHVSLVLGF